MRDLPSLNSLRAFDAAGRHLSFNKAALELRVSGSAISHQIKALESWAGTLLFTRSVRQVFLTAQGEELLRTIQCAFDQIEDGATRMRARNGR
jgi:LysR family glycine cleavage system transcriptional activator